MSRLSQMWSFETAFSSFRVWSIWSYYENPHYPLTFAHPVLRQAVAGKTAAGVHLEGEHPGPDTRIIAHDGGNIFAGCVEYADTANLRAVCHR